MAAPESLKSPARWGCCTSRAQGRQGGNHLGGPRASHLRAALSSAAAARRAPKSPPRQWRYCPCAAGHSCTPQGEGGSELRPPFRLGRPYDGLRGRCGRSGRQCHLLSRSGNHFCRREQNCTKRRSTDGTSGDNTNKKTVQRSLLRHEKGLVGATAHPGHLPLLGRS